VPCFVCSFSYYSIDNWTEIWIQRIRTLLCAFFWVILRRLNSICQRFGTLYLFHLHTYLPMKMKQADCSESLSCKIQTPRNYPEESTQHSKHGESLKKRIIRNLLKNYVFIFPQSFRLNTRNGDILN
jgi:hypothetical protein